MKVDVIVDQKGNVMGALVKGMKTKDGDDVAVRPAHPEHRLHEIDLPDDAGHLSADEFHTHIKRHLSKVAK